MGRTGTVLRWKAGRDVSCEPLSGCPAERRKEFLCDIAEAAAGVRLIEKGLQAERKRGLLPDIVSRELSWAATANQQGEALIAAFGE